MFAPFAEFSPEWQAVRVGRRARRPVRGHRPAAGLAFGRFDDPAPALAVGDEPPPDPLAALAAAAGEPDPERWWEDIVEHRGDGEPVFDAVGEAMAAVRAGTVTPPFDARREAHMRRRIRAALADARRRGRRLRRLARAGPRSGRRHGVRRRRRAARPPEGQGGRHLGAVDAPPARVGHGLRRRRRQPRLVRPRVPPPRPGGRVALLRRCRPRPAPPRDAGVARPRHRRLATGLDARRPPRAPAGRTGRGARCQRRRARRASRWSSTSSSSATPSARSRPRRRRSRWPATWRRPSGRSG